MSVVVGVAKTAQAVSLAVDLLSAINELSTKLGGVSSLIQKAHSEGRDITDEELQSVAGLDDAARERLAKLLE